MAGFYAVLPAHFAHQPTFRPPIFTPKPSKQCFVVAKCIEKNHTIPRASSSKSVATTEPRTWLTHDGVCRPWLPAHRGSWLLWLLALGCSMLFLATLDCSWLLIAAPGCSWLLVWPKLEVQSALWQLCGASYCRRAGGTDGPRSMVWDPRSVRGPNSRCEVHSGCWPFGFHLGQKR